MTREKDHELNGQAESDAEETAVLEEGLSGRSAGETPRKGLRRVHSSLYTLQAYKRWMHQIRESWKNDKR